MADRVIDKLRLGRRAFFLGAASIFALLASSARAQLGPIGGSGGGGVSGQVGLALPVANMAALRADLAVYDSAVYEAEPPLGCPISVYGGQDDPLVSENELRAWSAHTQAGMRLNMFPGDHFYLQSALPDLLEHIRTDLASCQKAGW